MRILSFAALLLLSTSHLINSASIPQFPNSDLIAREASSELISPPSPLDPRSSRALRKRKGGGGGRSSGGSSSSSSSGSSSGGSRSGGIGGGRTYSYSPSSNAGGRTRSGSGTPPAYGGYYAGGAKVPYAAGARSPRGFVPFLLPITAFAFFPGIWLYGSLYAYPYGTPYHYRNQTGFNQTVDVTCLCQQYSVCGCDDDGNTTFVRQIIAGGTDRPINSSEVVVLPPLANGTQRAYINGTLPNGTTAAGGEDPSSDEEIIASAAVRAVANYGGYWIMLMTVVGSLCAL